MLVASIAGMVGVGLADRCMAGPTSALEAAPAAVVDISPESLRRVLAGTVDPRFLRDLKYHCFGTYRASPAAQESACKVVGQGLARERHGSVRWFRLESVYAFAKLRAGSSAVPPGCSAYWALFSQGPTVPAPEIRAVLGESVNDLTFAVLSLRKGEPDTYREQISNAMGAAFARWLAMEHEAPGPGDPPDWLSVFRRVEFPRQACDAAQTLVDSAEPLDSPSVLSGLAAALADVQYDNSVEWVKQAIALVPSSDISAKVRLYRDVVSICDYANKKDEALAFQNECVAVTGHGRANLLRMYLAPGDHVKLSAVVEELKSPLMAESEVTECIDMLEAQCDTPAGRDRFGGGLDALVTSYLAPERPRSMAGELHARMALAQVLTDNGDVRRALSLLDEVKTGGHSASLDEAALSTSLLSMRGELRSSVAPGGSK